MSSSDSKRRELWADFLSRFAVYDESVGPAIENYKKVEDAYVQKKLLHALAMIGSPEAIPFVKEVVEKSQDDEVQAAAIYCCVELLGYAGGSYLNGVKPVGPKATQELADGLAFLKAETSPESPFGEEVESDPEFVERFGDLKTPVMQWLAESKVIDPKLKKFTEEQKSKVFSNLIEAKGFGLEAVKGPLFQCVNKDDLPNLLRLRAVNAYSPNPLTRGRSDTIRILIRHIRRNAK